MIHSTELQPVDTVTFIPNVPDLLKKIGIHLGVLGQVGNEWKPISIT